MKTVQETLKELDIEKLIDEYLGRDYIRREMINVMKKKDMTTKELICHYREAIREYIEYMRMFLLNSQKNRAFCMCIRPCRG